MKKLVIVSALVTFILQGLTAQITFTKSYGKLTSPDKAKAIIQNADGSYTFAGTIQEYTFFEDDIYLVKIDENGDTLWTNILGVPSSQDVANDIISTSDGGYLLAGRTSIEQQNDVYIIKTNASGDTLWTRIFDGEGYEEAYDIITIDNSNYLVVGTKTDTTNLVPKKWPFIISIQDNGDTSWTKSWHNSNGDKAFAALQNPDGTFMIAGETEVNGTLNFLLLKIAANGDSIWTRTYGENGKEEVCFDIDSTYDGGYVLFGRSEDNYWLLKTNAAGDSLWSKTYGGTWSDEGIELLHAADSGFILFGNTSSFGNNDSWDAYVIKVDKDGNQEWAESFGGPADESNFDIIQTADNGYAMCGSSKSLSGSFYENIYVLKLDENFDGPQYHTTISGDIVICDGDTVDLSADIVISEYNWSTGETTKDISNVIPTEEVYVDIADFMGMTGTSDTLEFHPLPVIGIVSSLDTLICNGATSVLSVDISNDNGETYEYKWSNTEQTATINVLDSGTHYVTVTDVYNCVMNDSIELYLTEMPDTVELCLVTFDTVLLKNVVTWNETAEDDIVYYNVYVLDSQYDSIGYVNIADSNVFVDPVSNGTFDSYRYKLTVIDTCGNESAFGKFHKSVYLFAQQNFDTITDLSWTAYAVEDEPNIISTYKIYRGTSPGELSEFAEVDGGTNSYSDTTEASKTTQFFYRVEGISLNTCTTGGTKVYDKIYSNIKDNGYFPTLVDNTESLVLSVYPNPFSSGFTLNYAVQASSKVQICLLNATGQRMKYLVNENQVPGEYQKSIQINSDEFEAGIYFIEFRTNTKRTVHKLIKY